MSKRRAADVGALVAILIAGALSTFWAFYVPIFQAPDEPAHFDYAMSIYQAKRLVRLTDGKPGWLVSPYTNYLLRASDFDRIAWHSSMRAPSGYGTRAYFAGLDAQAPSLTARFPKSDTINYIVPDYPFGFYALEALWMHTVAAFTGSLVSIFFAARLLCVFLLMLGLYFNYRTALELGMRPWVSAALVAAIGLLPLTSFVSSYIQPDNLAYTLVSAALFYAARFGRVPSVAALLALGIALGLLAVTKYQFFLCVALPVALLVVTRLPIDGRKVASFVAVAAALLPTAALLAVQHWYVDAPLPAGQGSASDINLEHMRSILALGLMPTVSYVFQAPFGAFMECFVEGGCAATYWQVVGWFDTPIVIGSAVIESAIRALISLASIATAVTILLLLVRNCRRIFTVATRGHAHVAARIASADAVFNSYLCFVAVMFALYIVTNNAFGAEGRHWYPVIFATFLCFVWYAPRALTRRYRTVTAAAVVALLLYSSVASGYALAAVSQRYYGAQTAQYVVTAPTTANIDPGNAGTLWPIISAAYHVIGLNFPTSFQAGTNLLAEGVVKPHDGTIPSTVAVVVDRQRPVPVLSDQYQFRVGEAARNPYNGYVQFYGNISTAKLGEGPHIVTAYAKPPGSGPFTPIPPSRLFFLAPQTGELSQSFISALSKAPTTAGALGDVSTCRGLYSRLAATVTVNPGALLLFHGTVERAEQSRPLGIWFLVDSRPYAAKLNDDGWSFIGTVPTSNLGTGVHRIAAYVVAATASSLRLTQDLHFYVTPGKTGNTLLSQPPAACYDPLRQLAGTK
ncbi:MAG: DUF2142 domain-containing protein [Candidatus Cybelea sp.]